MRIQRTSENFVVDMESLSNMAMKESAKSSWIMGGVTRKSLKCGAEKKSIATANANAHDHKTDAEKAEEAIITTPERPNMEAGGKTTDHSNGAQANHQITIATTISDVVGDSKCTVAGGKCIVRRSASRHTYLQWILYPKRILFFFATLSSMGTILLIYFTLSITNPQLDGNPP
ncbi:uncharacterized protein LOC115728134 [Rhodamnia argentea]|uniref:Uncharacterized protein LOC115728134 n=1 Tax=Rhodamnia argentea TaxID=178133 RepID=A0ABM3H820_9MYRT|nr:uncharacterized protein LOC115728134 [Rhodamnia argentea]